MQCFSDQPDAFSIFTHLQLLLRRHEPEVDEKAVDRWPDAGLFKLRGGEGYTAAGRNNDLTRPGRKAKSEIRLNKY